MFHWLHPGEFLGVNVDLANKNTDHGSLPASNSRLPGANVRSLGSSDRDDFSDPLTAGVRRDNLQGALVVLLSETSRGFPARTAWGCDSDRVSACTSPVALERSVQYNPLGHDRGPYGHFAVWVRLPGVVIHSPNDPCGISRTSNKVPSC